MEPWPLDRIKRSRLNQFGFFGLWLRWLPHNTWAISAMPIGAPGWPDLAFSTASMDRTRIALAIWRDISGVCVLMLFAFSKNNDEQLKRVLRDRK